MRESKKGYLIDGDDLAGVIEALRPDFKSADCCALTSNTRRHQKLGTTRDTEIRRHEVALNFYCIVERPKFQNRKRKQE